jgi:hypothetical protein
MNARSLLPAASIVVLATLAAADPGNGNGLAKGHEKQRQRPAPVDLDWKRDAKVRGPKDEAPAPAAPAVPDDIRVVVVVTPGTPRVAVPKGTATDTIPDRAARAADEMAAEAVRVWGFRQYWRAGFAQGVDQAMHDPRVAASEHAEGLRFGHFDPRALLTGQQLAQDDAGDQAQQAAEGRVRDQFMDLSRMPQRDRDPAFRPSAPSWAGAIFATAPVIDAVFTSMPLSSAPLSRDGRAALEGWSVQPAVLARGNARPQVYEATWRDADRAFSVWRDRQGRNSFWARLSSADRDRFRTIFVALFPDALAACDLDGAYAGWRVGYSDGWRYGASVQGEWAYRQGYAEGFDAGVRDAAAIAWPFAFRHAYASSYDAAFSRWSSTAQPAVTAVRVFDANDDGVTEPGERILVEADLVNYGGAPGTFDVRASGRDVDGDAARSLTLRARSRAQLDRPLDLHVDAGTPNRTDTIVTVSVGDDAFEAPVHVTHPLVIDDGTAVSADYLGGSVRLDVEIRNLSRRDLEGVLRTSASGGSAGRLADQRLRVAAGRSVRALVVADDLRPLDLIGGRAQWRLSVDRERGTDDERVVGPEQVATDLQSRDLLLYMVDLARSSRAPRQDVAEARALFLERMRADWERACAADGNPYKRDVENGSATTALGDLARTIKNERRGFESRDVFQGLGDDITSFAEELPGAHPLLRKWMKKLAKQVG